MSDTDSQSASNGGQQGDAQNQQGDAQGGQVSQTRGGGGQQFADWLANSALRIGIVVAGLMLFLFALGQAVGFRMLDLFVQAVTSQTGRWLVVALFALLLIVVGQRGVKHMSAQN